MSLFDDKLAAAFIDNGNQPRLLWRRLGPFSLWHRFLLTAINSPFFNEGAKVTWWDIRNAVGVCSLQYPDSKIRRPWLVPLLIVLYCGISRKAQARWLLKKRDALLEYFGDYIAMPEYTIVAPKAAETTPPPSYTPIPSQFAIVCDLIGFMRCQPRYVWNMPLTQAYWYQMGAYCDKGEQIDYLDMEERKFQAELKQIINMP